VFNKHSSLVPDNSTVITRAQMLKLGKALDYIHNYFKTAYSKPGKFYAMDVEFKFDGDPGEEPALFIKQARPYPGWAAAKK
jgi:hypothetical protein